MQHYHSLYRGSFLRAVQFLVGFRLLLGSPLGVYGMGENSSSIRTPCSFFDTVNVTGYPSFANGSYSYEGVIIPSYYVGTFDYIYINLIDRIAVAPHARGCVCKLKPCLNTCCPRDQIDSSYCLLDTSTKPMINVTLNDGLVKSVNIYEQFMVKSFQPCPGMFLLQPEVYSYDRAQLYENGTLLRHDESMGQFLSTNEFCVLLTITHDSYFMMGPRNCDNSNASATMRTVTKLAMLFSIPFMLLTIAIYLLIPELRNQHGKSLASYLVGLAIGYSMLGYLEIEESIEPLDLSCKVIGYTTYFFFMSAFFWLNVISFDLWHNFRGTRGINRFQEKKRFLLYSLYSWGLALLCLICTMLVQEFTEWPYNLKPGIGGGQFCWLDMTNWSAMIYFFGPIMVIIVANTVMFVMTAIKIHSVQREMARIIAREDSTRNLRTEKDKFGLFLRLFVIMGVTWSLEIISYFVSADKTWSKIFYASDLCTAMQGFLIFILFVLKKKVLQSIKRRYAPSERITS